MHRDFNKRKKKRSLNDISQFGLNKYTVNALYNFASCGRAQDRNLAWTNFDLSVECFKRAGVQPCGRAGVRACRRG